MSIPLAGNLPREYGKWQNTGMGSFSLEKDSQGFQRPPHVNGDWDDPSFCSQWTHTGQFRDYGSPQAVCQLCGNTGLRYHFLIAHKETGEALWVGSQCVLNFDLSAEAVEQQKAKAKQQALVETQYQQLMAILQEVQQVYILLKQGDQRKIRWIVGKFQQRGSFSPADLAWLFQGMAMCGCVPDFSLYSLALSAKRDRSEILQLGISGLRLIAPSLTDEQRKKCREWGVRLDLV